MPKTLLIVEDDKEEQEKAKKIYEEAGFKVIVAGTYEEFQQKARQFNYFNDRSQGGKIFYNDNDPNFPDDKKTGELVDYIITDLTFPADHFSDSEIGDFGYAVLARATKLRIPCSICTNTAHHGSNGKRRLIEEMTRITSRPRYSFLKNLVIFLDDCKKI